MTGKLDEFYGLTEFSNSPPATIKVTPGKPTIQPFVLNAKVPSADPNQPYCHGSLTPADGVALGNFRCLQSMLVRVDDGIVSAPNFNSSAQPLSEFYAYTAGHTRPFRGPGLVFGTAIDNPPAGYAPAIWNGTPQVFGVDHRQAADADRDECRHAFRCDGHHGLRFRHRPLVAVELRDHRPGTGLSDRRRAGGG